MRGSDKTSGSLFSYVDLEDRVPAAHPLRVIREIVNDALADLDASSRTFMKAGAAPRLRRSGLCARLCCRRFIRSVPSAS